MKKLLLLTVSGLVLTGQLIAVDEATFNQKAKEFEAKRAKIRGAFSPKDIKRLAKICTLELSLEEFNARYYSGLEDKVKAAIQHTLPGEDISMFNCDIISAKQEVKGEILEIAYNKLNNTEASQLDDFHQILQYCSKKHSLKDHGYHAAHNNALRDCLTLLGIQDTEDKLYDFEEAATKQNYSEYKNTLKKEILRWPHEHKPSLFKKLKSFLF